MTQNLSNTDMTKIQALHQKRTLAFVNHFVTTNVQFLNNFMRNCEQKLMDFEKKLEKVSATMVLLEARLSSVPELNIQESQPPPVTKQTSEVEPTPATEPTKDPEPDETDSTPPSESRPEYDRFLKMVQVGVPVQAVKLKVSLEGLDPNVFEQILAK